MPAGAAIGGTIGAVGGGYAGYKNTPEQTASDVAGLPDKMEGYAKTREAAAKAKKAADAAKAAKAAGKAVKAIK